MKTNTTNMEKNITYESFGIYKKVQQEQQLKEAMSKVSSANKEEDESVKAAKNTVKLLIDRITMMDGKDYTKRSWKRLMQSLDKALSVRGSKNPSASELNRVARQVMSDMSRLDEVEENKVQSNEAEKNAKLMTDSMKSVMRAKQDANTEGVTAAAESVAGAYAMGKMTGAAVATPVVEVTL